MKTNTKIGEKGRCDKGHIHTSYDVQNINFEFMRNLIKKLKAISAFFIFVISLSTVFLIWNTNVSDMARF